MDRDANGRSQRFISDELLPVVADAFADAGEYAVEVIQAQFGVAYPPASKSGEHPHERTGNLIASTGFAIDFDTTGPNQVTLLVYNTAFYAAYLRDGTSKMEPRDCFQPETLVELLPKVIDIIADRITSKFK